MSSGASLNNEIPEMFFIRKNCSFRLSDTHIERPKITSKLDNNSVTPKYFLKSVQNFRLIYLFIR